MDSSISTYTAWIDSKVEAEVRKMLVDYYRQSYQERVDAYVDMCLAIDHFAGRFNYLKTVIGAKYFNPLTNTLISGFGAGGEMIMARGFGLGKIYGVEVEQILVDATRKRLVNFPDMYPDHYDGETLPYEDGMFNLITSGHVIEHTAHPEKYLQEIIRVLASGGFLSLEFPDRFFWTEQHTNLPSFEWLPRRSRNYILLMLSGKHSPLSENIKQRYYSIVSTNLQQIGLGDVKRMLAKTEYSTTIINDKHPAAGIIRCVIRRN